MTNEKAIELLNRISDSQFDGIHGDERREALSMAVRALEGDGDTISRKAVMKEFSDFVRKSNNSDFAPTPTWNDAVSLVGSMPSAQFATDIKVGDTISRQQAIEVVEEYADRLQMVDWKENPCVPYKVHALNWCINSLRDLPTAQPQRKSGNGRWNAYYHGEKNGKSIFSYSCNQCGYSAPYNIIGGICEQKKWNFCPNCGCRMEGESE